MNNTIELNKGDKIYIVNDIPRTNYGKVYKSGQYVEVINPYFWFNQKEAKSCWVTMQQVAEIFCEFDDQ